MTEPLELHLGADEQTIRRHLAACYRLVRLLGWDDHLATHISARLPDDSFLINPFGLLFEEITALSLIRIDSEGNLLEDSDYPVNRAAFVIHSAVHEARPDAGCVMHLHTRGGAAVSALADGLLPLNQHALTVYGDLAYHDYEGVAVDLEERARLQADLGHCNLMLLRNHGSLTLGRTIGGALYRMYALEWACATQVKVLAMGRDIVLPGQDVIDRATRQMAPANMEGFGARQFWQAMLRRVERESPGFDL